ncbi:MAG: beta-lactamase family protein [Sulfurovum sp.]|nr:beta-lactamase family protein [Sulfurovum sp.]
MPEFSIKSRFTGSTDNITPRNIMTHHSKTPGVGVTHDLGIIHCLFKAYVYKIQNEYVAYAPNTMSYSNLALTLLGHSVEKVSGMAYVRKYVDKILFSPMEMNHADLKMVLSGDNESKVMKKEKRR